MINKIKAGVSIIFKIKNPIKVAHYITYRCNLSCDMCGRKNITSKNELTTQECINLQKEFKKRGTVVWSYSGGECLIRDDIIELSKSVKKLGMSLIIVTNGVLLPKKREILEYTDVINVSLDGNKESHDKLRGEGQFEKVINALQVLKNTKRKKLKKVIQTILNNETIEHLNFLLELAKEYDCELGFNPAIVHRTDFRDKDGAKKYFPSNEQFKKFVGWLENKKKNSGNVKYLFDDPGFFKKIGEYPDNPNQIPCYGGFFQCSIDPFGKVLPCSDFFDYEENYKKENKKYNCGYYGFKDLPRNIKCPYIFCCTAKKNYFFDNPHLILKKFL